MVNTRKYKKTKGGWPWSKSPQPVQADQNDCTVIATNSMDDINAIVDKDKLERLVVQRTECRNSNKLLEFTVNDEYIEDRIDEKKRINDQHKQRAKERAAKQQVTNAANRIAEERAAKQQVTNAANRIAKERAAKQQVTNAANHIAKKRKEEREKEKIELTKCIKKKRSEGVLPTTCPNYDSISNLDKNSGGTRRTKRKHKKCKKAKSKRRSIKRRMNK